ncbi:MAG TPA: glycosyl hydrolase [Cyclobacteriaceae bacterium]|jgi:hypothetical protein|nr:glycosyl hydrolase [Cyclobacteriaceae bacterium]
MLHAAPKFVTLCLIVLITSLANAQIQNQNPASAPTDFYVGKWVLTFIGTPQGDGVSRLVLERKNGNLTGEMVDPSGKGKPTPLTKVIENKDGIEISFSAQGFDVSVTLNKVDADNLKGSLMNMFEAKAVRIRESEDFFADTWVMTFIGTPQGDGVSHLVLERKNGNLTGEMVDPSGKGKPTPLTKVIENKDGIEISFSAQGFDVSVTLNKVDADNLKGSLMNMFEAKATRLKAGILSQNSDSKKTPDQQKEEPAWKEDPKAFGIEASMYYGASTILPKAKTPSANEKWFPVFDFDAQTFKNPPREFGPFTRWWWPGNDVTSEELQREVKLLADQGFGGVEIQPLTVGLNLASEKETSDRIYSWNTPEFFKHLKAVMDQAKISKVTVDMNGGSGWPMGGQFFDPKVSMRSLGVADTILQSGSTFNGPVPMMKIEHASGMGASPNKVFTEWGVLLSVVAAKTTVGAHGQILMDKSSLVDLTEKFTSSEKGNWLIWKVPTEGAWRLIATWSIPTGEQPSLVAKRGSNYVVDHLDPSIVSKSYDYLLGDRTGLPQYYGSPLRAVFNDSYEFHVHRMVSPDIKATFKKLNGYDITPFLSTVFKQGYNHPMYLGMRYYNDPIPYSIDTAQHWRLMYDYDLAVNEVFKTNFIKTSNNWMREHGMLHRTQAYGFPLDPIGSAGAADLPETEQLFADGSEGALKLATSGAHLYNRPIVSQESFVAIQRAEMTTPQKIKVWADKSLASGVNHFIYHGTPYKYNSGEYPAEGWNPWSSPFLPMVSFSSGINESDPFWNDIKDINAYLTRCQYALRAGKPQHDVLIYMPFISFAENQIVPNPNELLVGGHFKGVEPEMGNMSQSSKGEISEWYKGLWPIVNKLEAQGITWEFVNDESLQNAAWSNNTLIINGNEYQALILANLPYINLKTVEKVKELSNRGMKIWVVGDEPAKQPSYLNYEQNDKIVQELSRQIWSAGKTVVVKDNALPVNQIEQLIRFAEPTIWSRQINRQMTDGSLIKFICNQSDQWQTIRLSVDKNLPHRYWFDASTGQSLATEEEVSFRMAPYGSIFLLASKNPITAGTLQPVTDAGKELLQIETWNLVIGDKKFDNTKLFDWRENDQTKYESRKGKYSAVFRLKPAKAKQYFIDLGKVYYTAKVKINGTDAGKMIYAPYQLNITKYLKKGENTVEVEITTSRRNGFVGEAANGNKQYLQFRFKEKTIVPSGLVGPVRIIEK